MRDKTGEQRMGPPQTAGEIAEMLLPGCTKLPEVPPECPSEATLQLLRKYEEELRCLLDCGCEPGSPPCEKSVEMSSLTSRVILLSLRIGFELGAVRGLKGVISEEEVALITLGIEQ